MKTNHNLFSNLGKALSFSVLALFVVLFTASSASAQQGGDDAYGDANDIFRLGVEARFDYLNEALAGNQIYAASGFKVR